MKLAPRALPSGWKEERLANGTLRVQVKRHNRGCGQALAWSSLFVVGTSLYGCSGLFLYFGGIAWLPVFLLGGLALYQIVWRLGEAEVWLLAPGRFELRTSLLELRGKRRAWEGAEILIKGPIDLDTELYLVTRAERSRFFGEQDLVLLHRTDSLEDALGLAALLSDATGWRIEYQGLGVVFDSTLDGALQGADLDRLRLLLETRQLLPRLAREMQSPRRNALLGLMRESEKQHPVIEPALRDGHAAVRAAAIDLLAALEDPRALPAIREVLQGSDTALRPRAADALGHLRDREAVPALCVALGQRDTVSMAAARALGWIADPQSVPALCSALYATVQNQGAETRWEAARALGRIGDRAGVTALRHALTDAVPQVREAAAYALGQLGDPAAVPDLCRCLYDPVEMVAPRAAAALGLIRDESAVPALCGVVVTGVPATRCEALGALAGIGNDRAVRTLCDALTDPDSAVRRAAAVGIGTVAAQREHLPPQIRTALPALKRLCSTLSPESSEVKRACREALDRIEARTGVLKGLPVPAAPAPATPDHLPRVSDGSDPR